MYGAICGDILHQMNINDFTYKYFTFKETSPTKLNIYREQMMFLESSKQFYRKLAIHEMYLSQKLYGAFFNIYKNSV